MNYKETETIKKIKRRYKLVNFVVLTFGMLSFLFLVYLLWFKPQVYDKWHENRPAYSPGTILTDTVNNFHTLIWSVDHDTINYYELIGIRIDSARIFVSFENIPVKKGNELFRKKFMVNDTVHKVIFGLK